MRAQELADPRELMQLYRWLAITVPPDRSYDKLSAQIYDKLARVVPSPSIAVTLLLDNSGSMRGQKALALSGAALQLMELLDEWKIRTEVLGFTTRAWHGGQARALWLKDGRPSAPGRLSDLRHIVYKAFEEPALASLPGLGILAREDLLKEDFHGEALLWAYARLTQEREKTKILFMFTDGPPADTSTLSAQRKDFLDDHFKSVVEQIIAEEKILLQLIGINYDLSNVMADAINVTDLKLAGPVLNTIRAAVK